MSRARRTPLPAQDVKREVCSTSEGVSPTPVKDKDKSGWLGRHCTPSSSTSPQSHNGATKKQAKRTQHMCEDAGGGPGRGAGKDTEEDAASMSLDGGTDVGKRGKAGRSGGKPGRPRHYVLGEMKEEEEEELGDMLFRRELLARRLESLSAGGAGAVDGGEGKSTVPGRGPDVHWDYLLKEMQWMSADFQQERASHLRKRKKCAKAVVGYFKSMGSREERQAREEQEKRRRLAARIGREVKSFWRKVNQVVAFKQKLEVEEGRKRAMDKHLGFLLGQTERYSTMVARKDRKSVV